MHTDSNSNDFYSEKNSSEQKLNGTEEKLILANSLDAGNICKTKSNDDEDDDMEDEEIEDEEEEEEEEEEESGSPAYDNNCHMDNLEDDKNETIMVPVREIASIKANLQLLNHQMALLIRALNVKQCGCMDCHENSKKIQKPSPDFSPNPAFDDGRISNGFKFSGEDQHMQQSLQQSGHSSLEFGESTQRGRRSKYCTPAEKKAVASYVQIHGASAAARKFNIPPAVAAYYHRREYKNKSTNGKFLGQLASNYLQQAMRAGTDSSGEGEKAADGGNVQQQNDENKGGSNQQQLPWPTGSHAYLRGRGRGRPKLIGDELDAELVEYIVKLKQQTPNLHLTAAQALIVARNYIAQKAPGLLSENGGQVKLKITWAMKLVTRVQEREREIQLGLPPGTLQNLPRSLAQVGDPNMANAVVDELLNQQINVNALLAAATNTNEDSKGRNASDAAMLNAMLGMASGNAADLFGMGDQQPGTSQSQQQSSNLEMNAEEQDNAIRQLLASLHGTNGRNEQEATELDVAAALAQMSG